MIYFLIPVFNESPNIEGLTKDLKASLPDLPKYFVFVDDCSTDDTTEVIWKHLTEQECTVIEKKVNKGPGDSFNLGFEWILQHSKNESDLIVTIEGDNTSDLSILPKMIAISNLDFDIVLASVYAQGGQLDKTTFFRKLLSFFANIIMRFTLNLSVLTLSSFYRVYRIAIIKKIKQANTSIISENGFLSKVEILIKGVKAGASVIEVPTTLLSQKRKGKSKMKIYKTLRDYLRIIIRSGKFQKT